jgi:hypothetical protein
MAPRVWRGRKSGSAPVIGRIAGLPVDVVERLGTELCASLAEDAWLRDANATARAALADRIHECVPGAPPELRRLLLAVRRDCHNARPLTIQRSSPGWPALQALVGSLADEVLNLDARLADRDEAFRAAFARETHRQQSLLRELLHDSGFVRALALASPEFCRAARRLGGDDAPRGRRAAKTEAALLRYVTRAAVKVSPFSTFTPVAVGTLRRLDGPARVRLNTAGGLVRSLVRLRRYRLQQYADTLCRYPAFRDRLEVVLNDSAVESEPGRMLFLRPSRWEGDAERGMLRLTPDALGRTDAGTPLLRRITTLLTTERRTYGELIAALECGGAQEDGGSTVSQVERLLDLGALRLVLPWPVHEGRLEARMCAYLRSLPDDPGLAPFRECLERLVAAEDGYSLTADPAAAVAEMRRTLDALWEAAAPLGGMDSARIAYRGPMTFDFYEDVLLCPERGCAPVFHLSRNAAEQALRSAVPLVRLSVLSDPRHDLRATLADFAAEYWPGRNEVGVMELFAAAQPLWKDYLVFRATQRLGAERGATWNPCGVAELVALAGWRAEVHTAVGGCTRPDGNERQVDGAALQALLDGVPERYTDASAFGAALFLQPASIDGSRWRLNALREGTGRAGSRYTPVMEPGVRRRYAAHFARRGAVRVDGETAFLLDVQCPAGDTVNVHTPLAPVVLTLPGDDADVPPHRRVRLNELRVCFEGAERRPVLRGQQGRRFLPVHLGLAFEAYLPSVVRFLCAFGPGELSTVLPPRAWRDQGEVRVADRTVLDSLVVHRQGWSVPAAPLAAALSHADDATAFAEMNRLRLAWGIPDRVFCAEPVPHALAGVVYKPQYLDFTSPLFLPLLRDAAGGEVERLTFEEMLPTPEMLPRDSAGRRRAVEVIVDSAALRAPIRRARDARPASLRRVHPHLAATAAG